MKLKYAVPSQFIFIAFDKKKKEKNETNNRKRNEMKMKYIEMKFKMNEIIYSP